jgi:hypothetical protein
VVAVVEAQLAAERERAAAVVVARARQPAELPVDHLAAPRHVEADDRGPACASRISTPVESCA